MMLFLVVAVWLCHGCGSVYDARTVFPLEGCDRAGMSAHAGFGDVERDDRIFPRDAWRQEGVVPPTCLPRLVGVSVTFGTCVDK